LRQWVLSVPNALRFLFATRPAIRIIWDRPVYPAVFAGGPAQAHAPRGAVQAQQRAAHLQRIGQVGAALVNGVVPETAARQ
jgi:hypothetical protein